MSSSEPSMRTLWVQWYLMGSSLCVVLALAAAIGDDVASYWGDALASARAISPWLGLFALLFVTFLLPGMIFLMVRLVKGVAVKETEQFFRLWDKVRAKRKSPVEGDSDKEAAD